MTNKDTFPHVLDHHGSWYTIAISPGKNIKVNGVHTARAIIHGKPAPTPRKKRPTVSIPVQPPTRELVNNTRRLASIVEGEWVSIDKTVTLAMNYFTKALNRHYALSKKTQISDELREKLGIPKELRE